MQSSRKDLLHLLDAVRGVPILVVGDLIVDCYMWGAVERISPEAPVPVVQVKRVENRLGGAGNVCRNLRSLGIQANLCALIGDDDEGQVALNLLEQSGIARDGVVIDRGRATSIKTRVIAQGQQIVRIDREVTTVPGTALREGFAAVVDAHIDESRALIVSDYGKGVVSDALMHKLQLALDAGRLGLGTRPMMVDPSPRNYPLYKRMSIAKPNRKEAESATGIKITDKDSALQAARSVRSLWGTDVVLLSLGESGLLIVSPQHEAGIFRETVARQVFDVSGAGDTITALFTAATCVGASHELAGDFANIGAGVVVSEVGTAAVDAEKLKNEILLLAPE